MLMTLRSLAFRVLALSFILLALPLFVDSFILIKERYRALFTEAEISLIEINKEKEIPLTEALQTRKSIIPLIIHYLEIQENFPEARSEELNKKLEEIAKRGDFTGIYLAKIDGKKSPFELIGSTAQKGHQGVLEAYKFFENSEFQEPYYSTIDYNRVSRGYELISSALINSSTGQPKGFLVFTYDLTTQLKDILRMDLVPYPISFALILPDQQVIASTEPALMLKTIGTCPKATKTPSEAKESHPFDIALTCPYGHPLVAFTLNDQEEIGALLPVADTQFRLLSYASKEDIFSVPLKDLIKVYSIYALILLCGGGITALLTWRFAQPLSELTVVMGKIQKGDLSVRYKNDPFGYEINTLGQTFNTTIDTLIEKKALAEKERITRETYSKELLLGREVQRSLLIEKMPDYKGVELAERYLPARQVGGDFYDLFVREMDGHEELVLLVADASGKGVQACFYSLGVRSYVRAFAREFDEPAQVMDKTNLLFCEDSGDSGMFVTAAFAVYDSTTRLFRYFSSGHNPIFVRRANGEVIKLDNLGLALGFMKKQVGEVRSIVLEPHDIVLFYTDGVTEALNERDELFSEERLSYLLKAKGNLSAEEIAEAIIQEIQHFSGEAPQHDDITLLVMRVLQ